MHRSFNLARPFSVDDAYDGERFDGRYDTPAERQRFDMLVHSLVLSMPAVNEVMIDKLPYFKVTMLRDPYSV